MSRASQVHHGVSLRRGFRPAGLPGPERTYVTFRHNSCTTGGVSPSAHMSYSVRVVAAFTEALQRVSVSRLRLYVKRSNGVWGCPEAFAAFRETRKQRNPRMRAHTAANEAVPKALELRGVYGKR